MLENRQQIYNIYIYMYVFFDDASWAGNGGVSTWWFWTYVHLQSNGWLQPNQSSVTGPDECKNTGTNVLQKTCLTQQKQWCLRQQRDLLNHFRGQVLQEIQCLKRPAGGKKCCSQVNRTSLGTKVCMSWFQCLQNLSSFLRFSAFTWSADAKENDASVKRAGQNQQR